jgi:DNA-directed RNA polymerase specialized sigma24 family protein
MPRKRHDADGCDRTGKRGDVYLMAYEAGLSMVEIGKRFGVGRTAVQAAIQRAKTRAKARKPKK